VHPRFTISEDLMERTQLAVPLVVGRCHWLQEAARQFQAIGKLPEGWDGDGALRPEADSLEAAWGLLVALCSAGNLPKPHVHPTRDGGVQFEWESATRYFEIEVAAEGVATFFFRDDEGKTEDHGEILAGQPLDPILDEVRCVVFPNEES
jgi:hypothetical protein